MKKVSLVFRGRNSRRNFRGLNSETELVGKEVEVTEGNEVSQAEVAEVTVDKEGTTTLTLENGDEVELNKSEVEDLVETGQAVAEDEPKKEPEEFEVTRDVQDADGNETEVTTTVAAESEGDAVKTVETLDSRRGRNARRYRVNSNQRRNGRQVNQKTMTIHDIDDQTGENLPNSFTVKKVDEDEPEVGIITKLNIDPSKLTPNSWMSGSTKDTLVIAGWGHYKVGDEIDMEEILDGSDDYDKWFNSRKPNSRKRNSEPKEFKVVRKVDCDGKKFRKIASVTAPTVEEAIEAVQAKDNADNIKAEGYAELVEKEPKSMVTINADVEEVLEEPKPAEETKEETPETPVEESKDETPEVTEEAPEAPVEDDGIDRTSNSYKGVADFVNRRYGIKL